LRPHGLQRRARAVTIKKRQAKHPSSLPAAAVAIVQTARRAQLAVDDMRVAAKTVAAFRS
jgi:hypothetical protein